jgi:exodeoxyribonuclease VII large subunit
MSNEFSRVLTVAQLTQYIKNIFAVDPQLNRLRVSGEISNFKYHSSGHMYFTLKDAASSLRCVMFRSQNARLTFLPANGIKVVLGGRISVYERDGQYQMYVESMAPEGVGSLFAAFEELKRKLAEEGLFNEEYKQPLPAVPKRIGVVTSPTGAAVRDILTTLSRRFPLAEVLVVPVLVQGPDAASQIAAAIHFLNGVDGVDVLIIGRGGGSIEELWAFNEEMVARAIFASRVPVVAAVGHETDFTIADFTADVRAATPTAAAELVVPDRRDLLLGLAATERRMASCVCARLEHDKRYLERLATSRVLTRPMERLEQHRQVVDTLFTRVDTCMDYLLKSCKAQVDLMAGKLGALSPEAVLARGFAICYDERGEVLRDAANTLSGAMVRVTLQKGHLNANVTETQTEEDNER